VRREYNIIVGILLLGALIAFLTAHPESGTIVEQRATESYSDIFFTYTVIKYPATVEIADISKAGNYTIGINLDTNKLDFGIALGNDATIKREVNLTTKDGKNSRIHIKSVGNISPLLSFDKTDFVFNNKAAIKVILNTYTYPPGIYSGSIDVVIQRSNNDVLRYITGY
jgi:hypothetical protein